MKGPRRTLPALPLMLIVVWLASVIMPQPAFPDEEKRHFALGYSSKTLVDVDAKDANAALTVWVQEMGKQVGISARSQLYENIEPLIKDTQEGKIDMMVLPSLDYLRIRNRVDVEAGVVPVKGGKQTLSYVVLASKTGGPATVEGFRNKRLSVLKAEETSMVFLNTLLLRQRQPEARSFFSSVDEKTKISQVILSVFFQQSDVCVVDDTALKTMVELNPQVGAKLQVLASSPALTPAVALFRKGCPAELKQQAIDFMTRLKQNPRGHQVLMLFKIDDLARMRDSDLDSIRNLAAEHDRLKAAGMHGRVQ